jgi:hypothetical protein
MAPSENKMATQNDEKLQFISLGRLANPRNCRMLIAHESINIQIVQKMSQGKTNLHSTRSYFTLALLNKPSISRISQIFLSAIIWLKHLFHIIKNVQVKLRQGYIVAKQLNCQNT